MNVIVTAQEKTLDVTLTLMLAEPSDNARARGLVCGYATDKNTFLSTLTIELAAIENSVGHSGNEIDMTHMKNIIDTSCIKRFA